MLERVRLAEVEPYLQRRTEHREYERAVLGWCGVQLPWLLPTSPLAKPAIPQDQGLGQACQQQMVPLCRDFFGDQLPVLCRTCPGPKR